MKEKFPGPANGFRKWEDQRLLDVGEEGSRGRKPQQVKLLRSQAGTADDG